MSFDEITVLPTKEEAFEAHNILRQATTDVLLYTVGSKKGSQVGSGYILRWNGMKVTGALPNSMPEHNEV